MEAKDKIIRSLYGIGHAFNQANILAWYLKKHELETGILKYDPNYGTDFTPDNVLEPTTNLDPAYVKLGIVVTTNYLFIKIGVSPFSVKLTYALKSGELHRVEPDDYNIAYEGWMAFNPWKKAQTIEKKQKLIMALSNYFIRMPKRIFKNYTYLIDKYNNLEF